MDRVGYHESLTDKDGESDKNTSFIEKLQLLIFYILILKADSPLSIVFH